MKQFQDRYHKKDDKTYWFSSNSPLIENYLYGVKPSDKKKIDAKIEFQKEYLKNAFVNINDESYISLLDCNFSANLKPEQYHGEMFNRVKTIQDYAKELGYDTPVFITLTPPSYLKPLRTVEIKKDKLYKVVDNPKFIGFENYVDCTREYNSFYWTKFLRQRMFTELKAKFGERLIYMRTCEPQIDGSLHTHIMAFVPKEYKDRFINLVKGYFKTITDVKTDFDEDIGGVIAYILKYILKSFTNGKDGSLDDVGYWYAKHQIRRFTTSRTLVPMSIYRKLRHKEEYRDLMEMTKYYKIGRIQIEVTYDKWKLYCKDINKITSKDYHIASIAVISGDGIEIEFDLVYEKNENVSLYFIEYNAKNTKPLKVPINKPKPKQKDNLVPVYVDGVHRFVNVGNELRPLIIVPAFMRDFQLLRYYYSLNPENENVSLVHYGITQNECIKRGLIDGKIQSLNDFNLDFLV